ncbi:phosphoserine phosphatase SerB [Falsiroseomonas selenitidurans]|uniref:Phosphoserine phosphatase n=1 Tax=Falsiroseomonas selenitidurans TaxID=2716335 RepID=A0ABX1E780_9PROT|nr:phosphoserine phosphatase SerB [Falsiroseomonas selenitidurans]NKC33064.1 phosphoserine phosphatase SerB [Falsiroseomonas selenitidurans]
MPHILTLVAAAGALDPALLARCRQALEALGARPGTPDWLAEAEAVDLPFTDAPAELAAAAARTALDGAPVDAIAVPAEGRRKRLLVADMDSTIVTSETLDEIAAFAGLKDEIAAITRRSMNGELDFAQALHARVGMLAGLDVAALEATWQATAMMPGAATLVATMRAHGAVCCLASGGFTFFTGRVAQRLGFDHHVSNTLLIEDGKLTGKVAEPVFDRNAKLATLTRLATENALPMAATLAVGDGANDLDMIGAAGLGVAFRAKPIVATAARARVDHADLLALLFAQGYRRAEFRD